MAQLRWGVAAIFCGILLSGCEGTGRVLAGAVHGANEGVQSYNEQQQDQRRYQQRMRTQQYFYRSGNMICDNATGYCQRVQ